MSVLTEVVSRSDAGAERTLTSIVLASSIGTIIEWYDFLIYGTAAALVFNTLFFPNIDPMTGMLASLGTYAVGFLHAPLGVCCSDTSAIELVARLC